MTLGDDSGGLVALASRPARPIRFFSPQPIALHLDVCGYAHVCVLANMLLAACW